MADVRRSPAKPCNHSQQLRSCPEELQGASVCLFICFGLPIFENILYMKTEEQRNNNDQRTPWRKSLLLGRWSQVPCTS